MGTDLAARYGQSGFSALFAQTLKNHAERRGGDTDQVMQALGCMPNGQSINEGQCATAMQLSVALSAAAWRLEDEHVGLHIGMGMTPSGLGSLGYAAMTAPTGLDVVRLYEEWQQLLMRDVALRHHTSGAFTQIQAEEAPRLVSDDYPFWSFLAAFRLSFIRSACGQHVVPESLSLPCQPPRCDQALRAFVGAPVQFKARVYSEVFQASRLRAPNPQSSPEIHSVMATMARREWREACDLDDLLISRLKRCILGALDKGANPTLRTLAPKLAPSSQDGSQAVGTRQLQRKLAALRISFRDLVAEVRKERALTQLRSTNRPLVDIAVESGYAELSSFHRAVRRWTGLTPMGIRNAGVALDA